MNDKLTVFLATGLSLSSLPAKLLQRFSNPERDQWLAGKKWTGAGLIGSIEGAVTYLLLPRWIAMSVVAVVIGIALASYIGGRAEKILNSHDDSRIVIDEWIGVWVAMWGLQPTLSLGLLIAFVCFRLFDVFKGPLGHALQRLPGGWGVVLDDVYAGVVANVIWRVAVGVLGFSF